jgi:3-oxoacyl-[acyl-carrier-protein] synthase II
MLDNLKPSGRVVVTGLGTVSPFGVGVDTLWNNLIQGNSAAGPITLIDPTLYPTKIAAEVKGFNPEDWVEKKEARRLDRFIVLALAAAKMALDDSQLPKEDYAEHIGVLIGSGIGGLTFMGEQARKLFEQGPHKVSPFLVPYMIPDMASGYVSIAHKLKGPNTCVVTACATSSHAIGDAYHIIKRGDAVAMLAGGSESPINEISIAAFCASRAMTSRNDEPQKASRPFDADRDGFLIAEGSAVLLLEDYEFAKARGAKIYAEIIGYGLSGDAYHLTQPDPNSDGSKRALKMAIRNAGIQLNEVGYINAHGTSTQLNDTSETQAIKGVFGDHAYNIPISSTKSMMGHALGASGALEALVCIKTMQESIIPPTINLDNPDPACDLDYVPNVARKAEVNVSLSNSFGFGGHNATLIFKKSS